MKAKDVKDKFDKLPKGLTKEELAAVERVTQKVKEQVQKNKEDKNKK